jgi:hypothetical protein
MENESQEHELHDSTGHEQLQPGTLSSSSLTSTCTTDEEMGDKCEQRYTDKLPIPSTLTKDSNIEVDPKQCQNKETPLFSNEMAEILMETNYMLRNLIDATTHKAVESRETQILRSDDMKTTDIKVNDFVIVRKSQNELFMAQLLKVRRIIYKSQRKYVLCTYDDNPLPGSYDENQVLKLGPSNKYLKNLS